MRDPNLRRIDGHGGQSRAGHMQMELVLISQLQQLRDQVILPEQGTATDAKDQKGALAGLHIGTELLKRLSS